MRPLLLVACLFVVTLAGCTGPKDAYEGSNAPSPIAEALSGSTFNATGCEGHKVYVLVPITETQSRMPPGFKAKEAAPGVGIVGLEALECRQLSVDGADIGPGNWIEIYVGGDSPERPVPSGLYSQLLFSAVTTSPEMASALRGVGFTHGTLDLQFQVVIEPVTSSVVRGSAAFDEGSYAWEGLVSAGLAPAREDFRAFNAANPDVFWDTFRAYDMSRSQGGIIRAAPGSPLAELIPSGTAGATLPARIENVSVSAVVPHVSN